MNTSRMISSLGAAAAALLLSASITLASTLPAAAAVAASQPAATGSAVTVAGRGGPPTRPQPATPAANLPAPVAVPVPEEVVAAITAGIEDEWHAYAVYAAVIDQFGAVRPFTNIQRAEAQHAAAWTAIFERYDLPLPEQPTWDIPEFASLADACSAAAAAEVANLELYDQMLATLADYPDMVQVATALRAASLNQHLPAFERCAGTVQ